MFELSVALKYLLPRWRQLSVSIISTISILVIALVVWLVVVFFSVTHGLENVWTQRLIALTAPIRIVPTENYYRSYYYLADTISEGADYSSKTIREKLLTDSPTSYDPQIDEEPPENWRPPDLDENGEVKDLVKLAYGEIEKIPGVTGKDFEMTASNLKIRLLRDLPREGGNEPTTTQAFLSQASYLASFDGSNPTLVPSLLPLSMADLTNTFKMIAIEGEKEETPSLRQAQGREVRKRMHRFFDQVTVTGLKTPSYGWTLSKRLYPQTASFEAVATLEGETIKEVVIPSSKGRISSDEKNHFLGGKLKIEGELLSFEKEDGSSEPLPHYLPIKLEGDLPFDANLVPASIDLSTVPEHAQFLVTLNIQGKKLHGEIPFRGLEIGEATLSKRFVGRPQHPPLWTYEVAQPNGTIELDLPHDTELGEGILLPKQFRDGGVLVGDRGHIAYMAPTTSRVQEQRVPVMVTGFYDPGIIPIGGKIVLTSQDLTSQIRSSHQQEENGMSNGINVRFDDLSRAEGIKAELQAGFDTLGISPYWKIETYREFDFTKDLLQQLSSERNIWSLIAGVIIIVACSNIISMLIILVNDKKMEIGILRSMGASSRSIATIFGFCGLVMGLLGSLIGMVVAIFTLHNLSALIGLISRLQGYDAFNPMFYGDTLPNEVSLQALTFVLVATVVTSLLAGVVPAVKASLLRPSIILRSE